MQAQTTGRRKALLQSLAALAAVILVVPRAGAQTAGGSGTPGFPVPRAEKEFSALIPDLRDYCGKVTGGDARAFVVAASVYGPLDLEVRKARSQTEALILRDFHVGVAAAMSKMPEALVSRLGRPFLHAPADVAGRKQRLVQELPQIEAFVKRFRSVPQITLLAQWGFRDEYRVNDTFHMMGRTDEAMPSPVMGFVPSGQWKRYKTAQEYLDTVHVSQSTLDGLNTSLQSLLVVAARRTEGGGTEVIGLGIANNTSGLLFSPASASPPAIGQRTRRGEVYSVVDQVGPGVFYFETT